MRQEKISSEDVARVLKNGLAERERYMAAKAPRDKKNAPERSMSSKKVGPKSGKP